MAGQDLWGITPAYAGNTYASRQNNLPEGDHPRLRGEYTPSLAPIAAIWGSPPLTRGIPESDDPGAVSYTHLTLPTKQVV